MEQWQYNALFTTVNKAALRASKHYFKMHCTHILIDFQTVPHNLTSSSLIHISEYIVSENSKKQKTKQNLDTN